MSAELRALAGEEYCYLTTTGRATGRPHTIEIWFAAQGDTLYLLSGGRDRSDWVKNLRQTPQVTARIADSEFPGHARIVEEAEEDALARKLLVEKYAPRYSGDPSTALRAGLSGWRRTALPVAIDIAASSR